MKNTKKEYIGDSVYATIDDYRGALVLTTENGYGASNTIYIETEVLVSLISFAVRHELLPPGHLERYIEKDCE